MRAFYAVDWVKDVPCKKSTFVVVVVVVEVEMGIEPNSNRTNRTITHILGRTEPN